jgi:hypothetical protein
VHKQSGASARRRLRRSGPWRVGDEARPIRSRSTGLFRQGRLRSGGGAGFPIRTAAAQNTAMTRAAKSGERPQGPVEHPLEDHAPEVQECLVVPGCFSDRVGSRRKCAAWGNGSRPSVARPSALLRPAPPAPDVPVSLHPAPASPTTRGRAEVPGRCRRRLAGSGSGRRAGSSGDATAITMRSRPNRRSAGSGGAEPLGSSVVSARRSRHVGRAWTLPRDLPDVDPRTSPAVRHRGRRMRSGVCPCSWFG